MDKNLLELEKSLGANRVRTNEPMSAHTTFKIGGPAQYYVEAQVPQDLINAVRVASRLNLPILVLGGGSNIIITDNGIRGLVVKNNCRKFGLVNVKGKVKGKKLDLTSGRVYAESGVIMNQLVRFTIDQGLGGLEYQLGLPGTVGGAMYMNSNFPKKSTYVGDCVEAAKILTPKGEEKEVERSYFHFAYDASILQRTGEIVLSVIFKLNPEDKKTLWERGMEALNYRNETQPKGASAGCTFRNISLSQALLVPTPNNTTSAGYLIDKAGLKGKRIGNAMISPLHANFILNMGQARADDVIGLVTLIKEEVYKKFSVNLHLEVKKVGF